MTDQLEASDDEVLLPENFDDTMTELVAGLRVMFEKWFSDPKGRVHITFVIDPTTEAEHELVKLARCGPRMMMGAFWRRPRMATADLELEDLPDE